MSDNMDYSDNAGVDFVDETKRPRRYRAFALATVLVVALGAGGVWALGASSDGGFAVREEPASDAKGASEATGESSEDKAAEAEQDTVADAIEEKPAPAEGKRDKTAVDADKAKKASAKDKAAHVATASQADKRKPAASPKKWGVVKPAWDETVVVKEAWTEKKLSREAWTEYIDHPAEYKTVKVKVGVIYICDTCGFSSKDEDIIGDHLASMGHIAWTKPIYEERTVLVKEAWTEELYHRAEYKTVYHPAETKSLHHDAVYKTVHHKAEYGWI